MIICSQQLWSSKLLRNKVNHSLHSIFKLCTLRIWEERRKPLRKSMPKRRGTKNRKMRREREGRRGGYSWKSQILSTEWWRRLARFDRQNMCVSSDGGKREMSPLLAGFSDDHAVLCPTETFKRQETVTKTPLTCSCSTTPTWYAYSPFSELILECATKQQLAHPPLSSLQPLSLLFWNSTFRNTFMKWCDPLMLFPLSVTLWLLSLNPRPRPHPLAYSIIYLRCIQCHVNYMTLDAPKISFWICSFLSFLWIVVILSL